MANRAFLGTSVEEKDRLPVINRGRIYDYTSIDGLPAQILVLDSAEDPYNMELLEKFLEGKGGQAVPTQEFAGSRGRIIGEAMNVPVESEGEGLRIERLETGCVHAHHHLELWKRTDGSHVLVPYSTTASDKLIPPSVEFVEERAEELRHLTGIVQQELNREMSTILVDLGITEAPIYIDSAYCSM